MQPTNAPLTSQGRLRLVPLIEEEGFTLQVAAMLATWRSRHAGGVCRQQTGWSPRRLAQEWTSRGPYSWRLLTLTTALGSCNGAP
jgi:hypothetical protein